jgi:hypothetical protein
VELTCYDRGHKSKDSADVECNYDLRPINGCLRGTIRSLTPTPDTSGSGWMRVLLQVLQSAFEIIFGTIINVYSLSMGMFTNICTNVMRLQLEALPLNWNFGERKVALHRPCGLRLRLNGLFSVFSLLAREVWRPKADI